MLNAKQTKALECLLLYPTMQDAAKAAGIDVKTLRRYLQTPEFQNAYKQATRDIISSAAREAQQAISPAIKTLRSILEDESSGAMPKISAARAIIDYGLRLTEIVDIISKIEGADNNVL